MRRIRLFSLVSLSAISFTGIAQIDIQRYTTATDTFYWKRYIHVPKPSRLSLRRFSVVNAGKKVESFLANNLGQFPQFTNDSTGKTNLKELKKCLFPVEINDDNLPDMIFCGNSGGGLDIVRIWINRRDSFELIFEDYQYISKFRKVGNKLVEMQTGDVGCCGNYLYFTRDYQIGQENGELSFVKGKQVVVYQYTEEPEHYYPEPVPFTAKADTMMLRASASMQNEPFNPKLDTFGNIVAKYRSKAKGNVLAYKSYGKGNYWYFVEISPSATPSASILYDVDKLPTYIRGWVSGLSILF